MKKEAFKELYLLKLKEFESNELGELKKLLE